LWIIRSQCNKNLSINRKRNYTNTCRLNNMLVSDHQRTHGEKFQILRIKWYWKLKTQLNRTYGIYQKCL
jgi:hypothetical protein